MLKITDLIHFKRVNFARYDLYPSKTAVERTKGLLCNVLYNAVEHTGLVVSSSPSISKTSVASCSLHCSIQREIPGLIVSWASFPVLSSGKHPVLVSHVKGTG